MTAETTPFVVVLRVPASPGIKGDEELRLGRVRTAATAADLRFTSRRMPVEGSHVPVLGDLHVEATLNAASLQDALPAAGNAVLVCLPLLALSANAAVGEPEVELGYGAQPGAEEHPFFQNFLPEPTAVPDRVRRSVDLRATVALGEAVDRHPGRERIHRAMSHYRSALDHWRYAHEALALALLYIGVEALTDAGFGRSAGCGPWTRRDWARRWGCGRR